MADVSSVREFSIAVTGGGVAAPAGFRSAAVHCGIKKKPGALDLTVIAADVEATAAALFTILPFGSARADRIWPDATLTAYAIIAVVAVTLTGAAILGTTRRTLRGPAVTALR